jgi:hypothetical protein
MTGRGLGVVESFGAGIFLFLEFVISIRYYDSIMTGGEVMWMIADMHSLSPALMCVMCERVLVSDESQKGEQCAWAFT